MPFEHRLFIKSFLITHFLIFNVLKLQILKKTFLKVSNTFFLNIQFHDLDISLHENIFKFKKFVKVPNPSSDTLIF